MLALASSSLATAAPAEPAAAEQGRVMSRGAYLSIAADCVACHTTQGGKPYAGGYAIDSPLGKIWSTNITPSKEFGIGSYSQADFARAVREGVAKDGHHLYPAMPYTSYAKLTDEDVAALYDYFMKEVTPVETATPHTDLHAIVAYLKQTKAIDSGEAKPRYSIGKPDDSEAKLRGNMVSDVLPGWRVYTATCAACHGARGEGTSAYPSLFHNTTTGADNPANLIATILYGVHRGPGIEMPGFGPQASYTERLSDQQIADVSNYVLASFGQAAAKVTQEDVALARAGGPQPAIIKIAQIGVPAGIVVLLLLIVFIVARKRRARK